MKKVEINNVTLLLVEIPLDVTDYKIIVEKKQSFLSYNNCDVKKKLPSNKFKILGEVLSNKIEFDFKDILDKKLEPTGFGGNKLFYYDYVNEDWISSYVLSFYSFLAINGFIFFNTATKNDKDFGTDEWDKRWKKNESKIIRGKILVMSLIP